MKDLIYVKPIDREQKGLIVLPPDKRDTPALQGEIMRVGPDCEDLKEGDRIIHKCVTGLKFEYEGEDYLGMHENEVLAVVDG